MVGAEITDSRITQRPRHRAPPTKQVPSAWSAADRLERQAIRRLVGIARAEAHDDLVEHHVVQHLDAGFGASRSAMRAARRQCSAHHLGDALAAEMADHRPGREAARAARQFGHEVRRIALASATGGR